MRISNTSKNKMSVPYLYPIRYCVKGISFQSVGVIIFKDMKKREGHTRRRTLRLKSRC